MGDDGPIGGVGRAGQLPHVGQDGLPAAAVDEGGPVFAIMDLSLTLCASWVIKELQS